jgi:hypothetical protein
MTYHITVTCCCCKKQAQPGDNSSQRLTGFAGWVSIDRKAFCGECLALFTVEDWDWCVGPPVPLGAFDLARLIPEDVEPL